MSTEGLAAALARMTAEGAGADPIEVFRRFYRQLEDGADGMIAEGSIEPVGDLPRLADLNVADDITRTALEQTVVIKLNGGLGTSMGMDRAKSLLPVKDGLTFLDVIARQVLHLRETHHVRLPLIFMNSFRTRADTLAALARYPALADGDLPVDFAQNREPKLRADDLSPVDWPADPDLEWCPPGHGDLYPALRGSGLLDQLLADGFRWAFVSNADNLGAVPDPRLAGWMAAGDVPFALESVRRTPADRKGGHLAVRRSDGRLILRETAQTSADDMAALQDLDRHRYCNTNNVWIDLVRLAAELDRNGALDLPLIRNAKTVDPADATSTPVIQIESAMGAAVQCFAGAASVLVERDRFVPVKTTNDLLVLRSDLYRIDDGFRVVQTTDGELPFVDLDPRYFKMLADFERHFPDGVPSLVGARRFAVRGDVTVAGDAVVRGDVTLEQ
jgi:UTP--glucose-1-phosphate uridylyltransferase